MTTPNIALRYVVALNNISVSLLHRGCYDDAIETMKSVCTIMKKCVSEPYDILSATKDEMASIINQYRLGIQRLANSKVHCNGNNDNFNVHIISLSNNCINIDDINSKDTVYPFRIEYIDFDNINLISLLSIQLYNFSLMYLLNLKRVTIPTPTDCITNHRVIAKNLILWSYSLYNYQCDEKIEEEMDATTNIHFSILLLRSLIIILEESHHGGTECDVYRSELLLVTKRLKFMDQSTKDVLFPRVTSASAA